MCKCTIYSLIYSHHSCESEMGMPKTAQYSACASPALTWISRISGSATVAQVSSQDQWRSSATKTLSVCHVATGGKTESAQ